MVAAREAGEGRQVEPKRATPNWRTVRIVSRRALSRLTPAAVVNWLTELMPKGLYARALIIIIAPIVLLESVVAFVFMERHWQVVTRRLAEATTRDIAAVVSLYEGYPFDDNFKRLTDLAGDQLGMSLQLLPPGPLPARLPRPFFALLDKALGAEIAKQIKQPVWIDTIGQSRHVEIRVKLDRANLRFIVSRAQTHASNSHIFLIWMVGSSMVLLTVAILFLRNQIKPILRLAEAADEFGKGRPIPEDFRPRGAREVRQAAQAFLEMRDRIKIHVDQRTTMLAGVSHDLRTVLTRFKLTLALMPNSGEARALEANVVEMQHMLEDYLDFAKGDGGEEAKRIRVRDLLEEIHDEALSLGWPMKLEMRRRRRDLVLPLKRQAMKRALTNLVSNAARFSSKVVVGARTENGWLLLSVDDDGPGIPAEKREMVFKPFFRLDHSRNQNDGNSGLGLAIARDIVRSHGGEIELANSRLGGLSAIVRIPL